MPPLLHRTIHCTTLKPRAKFTAQNVLMQDAMATKFHVYFHHFAVRWASDVRPSGWATHEHQTHQLGKTGQQSRRKYCMGAGKLVACKWHKSSRSPSSSCTLIPVCSLLRKCPASSMLILYANHCDGNFLLSGDTF